MDKPKKFTKEIVETYWALCKGFIEKDGVVEPMAFMLSGDGKPGIVMALGMSDNSHWRPAIEAGIKESNASGMLMVAESWTLPSEDCEEYAKNRAKYKNLIANHPRAIECVMFTFENRDGSYEMGTARILREKGKKPTLLPIRWSGMNEGKGATRSGRFTHFFG